MTRNSLAFTPLVVRQRPRSRACATSLAFVTDRASFDIEVDQDANGFYIDEYELDEDHWREGYVTV